MGDDGAQQTDGDGETGDGGDQCQTELAAGHSLRLGRLSREHLLLVEGGLLLVGTAPTGAITAAAEEEDEKEEQCEDEPEAWQSDEDAQRLQVLIVRRVKGDIGRKETQSSVHVRNLVEPLGDDGHVVQSVVREDGHRWLVQRQVVRYEDGHLLEKVLGHCHPFVEDFTGGLHLATVVLVWCSYKWVYSTNKIQGIHRFKI